MTVNSFPGNSATAAAVALLTMQDALAAEQAAETVQFVARMQSTDGGLKPHAAGLTPRVVFEQLKAIQMLDVRVPTTDGRWLHMARYTQPDKTQQVLLAQLGLHLPMQPPPKIELREGSHTRPCGEDLRE